MTHRHAVLSIVSGLAALSITVAASVAWAFASWSTVIPLPAGWQPEGIAAGPETTVFVGSIPTGAIYQADAQTGTGGIVVPAQPGRAAIGIKWDRRTHHLYVAGGPTGMVFVYDADTGADVATLQATAEPATFVNDVVVTRRAAYFTDSLRPAIYELSLERHGRLPADPVLEEISLGGDFESVDGDFNANGIAATRGGRALIVVNSALGTLYRVDPETGDAALIDLGGDDVINGDGILLLGGKLYVVQNFLNQIAVIDLAADLRSGTLEQVLTSDGFDIPTTVAAVGPRLYAVNARFTTEPTPETSYDVIGIPRPRDSKR